MTKSRLYAASLIILIGLAGVWESTYYKLGTLANMGPGYYPLMLSVLLIILGILVAVVPDSPDEFTDGASPEDEGSVKAYFRPWLCVLGGAVAFVILGQYGGFAPATFVMILVAALGDRENSIRDALLLAVGVVVFMVVVFHYGMQVQFPLWRWG